MAIGYTAGQTCRLTGLKYDRLDHWDRTAFISPSIATATGVGSERLYSFRDLVALRVARELRDAGIPLQSLRKAVEFLRSRGYEQPLSEVYLVSDGSDVFERRGDEVLSVLRRPGQAAFAWVIDLAKIVEELRAALAA